MAGRNMGVAATTQANTWAPAMLAVSTIVHSRSTLIRAGRLRRVSRGMIAVRVFSVNSCCRPDDDDQESQRVPQTDQQSAPGSIRKVGIEKRLSYEREAHRQASGESGPCQRRNGSAQLFFAVMPYGFVNDYRAH